MPQINDKPNTPGTIGYDDTKPATYSGSSPGIPIGQGQQPDWIIGKHAYDVVNDQSSYRVTVHAGGETFSAVSDPMKVSAINKESAIALLRKLADQMEAS